ncbi:UNVERIFIED_ORG: hypothetical protein FHR35_004789 [Microbispora rosea subsp. rosea]
MAYPDRRRLARVAAYAKVSTALALMSDHRLAALLLEATPLGTGIGGTSAVLDVEGARIFVKRIPLTDLELRPDNRMSTRNVFGLPGFYQYGVGSAGFGAWRELAVHQMATNWVLAGEFAGFPLAYHWRVLPVPAPPTGLFSEFGGLEGAVAHWDGAPAVRRRLEALERSTMSIAVFLEHIPHTLGSWLADKEVSAFPRVERELAEGVAFMRSRHLIHFDAHFRNVLTDGDHLYFSDFGLALSSRFELSASESDFHRTHRDYDHDYVMAHLVNQHLAERVRGGADRRRFVRGWADGDRRSGVAASAAVILDRHAGTAAVMDDFHRRLCESKHARYPADEFGHIRCGAGPGA